MKQTKKEGKTKQPAHALHVRTTLHDHSHGQEATRCSSVTVIFHAVAGILVFGLTQAQGNGISKMGSKNATANKVLPERKEREKSAPRPCGLLAK